MAEYLIQGSTLENIANAIREKGGTSTKMSPAKMAQAIADIETRLPTDNGVIWQKSNMQGSDVHFTCLAYGDGVWVAGTAGGKGFYYSTNGMTWKKSVPTYTCNGIVFANGLFVAAVDNGGNPTFVTSADGRGWGYTGQIGLNLGSAKAIATCVTYGNGVWVSGIKNADSDTGLGLCYSENGKDWRRSEKTNGKFTSVYYANGLFLAGSDITNGIYYSTDGKAWTQADVYKGTTSVSERWGAFLCANGMWVAGSAYDGGICYSQDGKTWEQCDLSNITDTTVQSIDRLEYANGVWVAGAGSRGSNGLYYSEDGITWNRSNITSDTVYSLRYANGMWVTGHGGLSYSTDGKTWTKSNMTSYPYREILNANGVWVAVGQYGNVYSLSFSYD